jgi:hypothetical protein
MNQRQDDLSTADLADPQPTGSAPPDRLEPADPEHPDLTADDASRGGPVLEEGGQQPAPTTRVDPAAASDEVGRDDATSRSTPLLASQDAEGFRARWTDVQTGFVDAPRRAVERADGLVAELMQHLAGTFADERTRLERQWDRGDDVPTDDLRTAFQRYRSFFERLLAT